jgi:1,4-alpha-glucan branching enzyme
MKRRAAPKPPRKPEVPLGIAVEDLRRLEAGELADPQRVLGPRRASVDGLDGFVVRGFHPDAIAAECLPEGRESAAMKPLGEGGLFGCFLPSATGPLRYRLRFRFRDGSLWEREDPYRFPVIPGEVDLHLFSEGTHRRLWEMLGAHPRHIDGVAGVAFAVWTPNALRVSVVGDFCGWDGRLFPMRHIGGGVFELFIPEVQPGTFYKYEIKTREGAIRLKADPFAFAAETPPGTASRVAQSAYQWRDAEWMELRRHRNPLREPIAIYEVHLGSWARVPEEGNRWLSYREIAPRLIEHMKRFSFTHLELLPIAEHPFDGSWGYQLSSYFAPTARYGPPDDFRYLIDLCHRNGIGVILDWVPAHFPRDDFALRRFDGTALYEHDDPRLGEHPDWGTLIFNYERNEVRNFLISNALYWFEEFHIDGLRADAVASMLYRDYSRESSDWIPNHHGGRENLGAVVFLRALNEAVRAEQPDCFIVAEESTAWPGVSRPVSEGGLGFTFKWNMGWMHDTLCYLERDPVHRSFHHDEFTFAALYEHTEHFIMPLSHDEVVHGKRSLLEKMPGDFWQKFANLRLLFSYQYTRPGKKLLFMGSELAPHGEWDYRNSLDWHLANDPPRMGLARLLEALGRLYRQHACLWRADVDPEGFAWIGCDDRENSVFSYLRRSDDDELLIILNATPVPRYDYQIGAPRPGRYVQILSSDYHEFGGSGFDSPAELETEPIPFHGHPQSLRLRLPPLGALVLAPVT